MLTHKLNDVDLTASIHKLELEGLTDSEKYPTAARSLHKKIESLKRKICTIERDPETVRHQELKAPLEAHKSMEIPNWQSS